MKTLFTSLLAATAGVSLFFAAPAVKAGNYERVPAPRLDIANDAKVETAVFAGGCFWGVEAVFERVKGVKSAVSGFAGGDVDSPEFHELLVRWFEVNAFIPVFRTHADSDR